MDLRGFAASSKGKGREIADHLDGGVAQPLVFLEMLADKGELRTELARLRQFFFVYNAICRPSLRLQFCFIRASKQLGEIVGSCR